MKKNNWDALYEKGYRARYPNEDVVRFIQSNFPDKKGRENIKILDIGSGTGRHIIYLADEGFNVYGVEVAKKGIDLTKKWLKNVGLKAVLRHVDLDELPFADGYFDAVIDCASSLRKRRLCAKASS